MGRSLLSVVLCGGLAFALAACETAHEVERAPGVVAQDEALTETLEQDVADFNNPAYRGVSLAIWQGHAVVMGAVVRPSQKKAVASIVKQRDDVQAVSHDMVLGAESELPAYTKPDPYLENRVRQQLGLSGESAVIVRTINGVVFLLGGVVSQHDADILITRAGEVDGVKWVVPHLFPMER